MKQIAAAMVKAQKAFGPALKTKTNPHLRTQYADLSACIEAVIDALNENGVMLMQHTHDCDDGVVVETVFVHESGEVMTSGRLHVPAPKKDPQGYGSALTYARRYSLMAACGIAPEDDDGEGAKKKTGKDTEFDVVAALNAVAACTTLEQLGEVWKKYSLQAVAAQDKGGHAALKDAVNDKKLELK